MRFKKLLFPLVVLTIFVLLVFFQKHLVFALPGVDLKYKVFVWLKQSTLNELVDELDQHDVESIFWLPDTDTTERIDSLGTFRRMHVSNTHQIAKLSRKAWMNGLMASKTRYGWSVSSETLVISPGVMEFVDLVFVVRPADFTSCSSGFEFSETSRYCINHLSGGWYLSHVR